MYQHSVCGPIKDLIRTHFVWMDHQHGLAVDLLDLLRGDQVGHAHRPPPALSLPQDRVHGGQQGTDVPLLALNPVQDLEETQAHNP